jgi:hypothetical protein
VRQRRRAEALGYGYEGRLRGLYARWSGCDDGEWSCANAAALKRSATATKAACAAYTHDQDQDTKPRGLVS